MNRPGPISIRPAAPARPGEWSPAPPTFAPTVPGIFGTHWVYLFIVFELACQVALIVPGIAPIRPFLRIAVFGASLGLMLLIPRGRFPHPAIKPGICAMLIIAMGLFHPHTNSVLAGFAAVAMNLAIIAPLIWVSGLRVDVALLRRVAMILWTYHTISAGVGVLQMYFPGEFQPEPSVVFMARGDALVEGGKITLASGRQVFRPMGLSDIPGGAAPSGLSCLVFSLGIWTVDRRLWMNLLCIGSMMCGFFCIYLSQVRSILVMAVICQIMFGVVILTRRDYTRLSRYIFFMLLVTITSTSWALWVGGAATLERLKSLVAEDPRTVYYHGRGFHLHYTWNVLLPEHPLGAGLGNWGMINYYFGRKNPIEEPLWAEIQWTAWLFDGGVPLIIAYTWAVLLAVWVSWKIAVATRAGEISLWGSVLCASNVAALAVTFNYPIFMSQGGMEFWLLNACLWAAWVQSRAPGSAAPAAAPASAPQWGSGT